MSKSKEKKEKIEEPKKIILPHTVGDFYQGKFLKKYDIASLVIAILSFAIYYQSMDFGYVLDDKIVITDNAFTKKGFAGIGDIMTKESFVGYFGKTENLVQGNRYRPLSIATFAIEQGVLSVQNPMISHCINIILYSLTCLLFLLCCSLLFRNYSSSWYLSIPFWAALIYTTHPVHVEAVANIKGRDEIMTMLFSLGALYGALRYSDSSKKGWLLTTIVSYFLALLSKENALTFLAIIPLSIYFYSHGKSHIIKTVTMTLLAVSVLFIIIRTLVVGQFIGGEAQDVMNNPFYGMTKLERMGSTMYTLLKYIGLLLFPHPLSHDYYPYQIPKVSIFTAIPMLSVAFYSLLGYFAWRGWKTKSSYAYGILLFICALSMMSNIVVNVGTFMNERFLFIPSAGFAIIVAYLLSESLSKKLGSAGKWVGLGLTLAMVAGYSWKVLDRVPAWEDSMTLNRSAVLASPNSARANAFMATAYFEEYQDKFPNAQGPKQVKYLYNLLDSTQLYAQRSVDIIPDYANGNQMLLGNASERYKIEYDILLYVKNLKPIILRRPDLPFIKDFSEYMKTTGNDEHLFAFYKDVGLQLLEFKDNRKVWAIQYLTYAYNIRSNDRSVVEGMAMAYAAAGSTVEANRWAEAAKMLQ